ncbi:properdin [Gouania willdenowi]|uniref:properdin n=1 Tax=Gouania willdenowi TaxID=441366 RepID=UPI00105494B7|nr:properdin [Gouania willdenowi]
MECQQVLLLLVVLLVCVQYSECGRCFAHFDIISGKCDEEIGELETDVCCLNPKYGHQGEDGLCVYCGPPTWSPWSPWSQCNTLCREGVRTRSRKCQGFSQSECTNYKHTLEMEPCNGTCCTRDPGWDTWLPWSSCSVTCGVGVRRRVKSCPSAVECSLVCSEPLEETGPFHGGWSGWSRWSDCSASCISDVIVPIRHSVRSCSRPAPSTDTLPPGNACDGPSRKEKACSELPNCPVDGKWGLWSPLGPCSVTCGAGLQLSNRVCDSPAPKYGGKYCDGPSSQTSQCDSVCPVHGFWTGWSAWSECSSSCIPEGQVPFRAKQRSCSNPAPSSNPPGQPCIGKPTHQEKCQKMTPCAVTVNGHWGEWSAFSSCSVTCGAGLELSVRHCDNPAPKHNGHPCPGERQRTRVCFTNVHCPVDGVWSEWSQWGKCTYPRGKRVINCKDIVGQQDRDRRCDHLSFNGSICSGEMSNDRLCYDVHNCDVMGNWDGWEPWSLCNPTCGKSKRTRKRHCEPDFSNYSKSKRGQKVDTFFGEMLLDCADHKDGDSESQPCLNVPPCS